MALIRDDRPMTLGAHLDELRKAVVFPIIVFCILFIVAFAFQKELKIAFVHPLHVAMDWAGPQAVEAAGLPLDRSARFLKTFDLAESVWISVSLAFWAALMCSIPLFIWRLWHFVAVGLIGRERALGLLFIPVGVACFYIGVVSGYLWGLPLFYAWLINFQAHDPITQYELRLEAYRDSFLFYCGGFGLLACIPWLVVVLCRVGIVTVQQLSSWRKGVIMVNAVISGIITPPDAISMLITMCAVQILFELGLGIAWVMQQLRNRAIARAENRDQSH